VQDRFSFEGLEPIESRIRKLAEDIGYLVVQDRTDHKKDETLGRFDLTATDAEPYLEAPPAPPPPAPSMFDDGEPADPADEDGEEDDGDDGVEEEAPPPADGGPPTMARIADAACRWIRDITIRNTVGAPYGRFRVKVYSPKGASMVDSGQFVCRNHGVDLDIPAEAAMPDLRIPAPTFEQAAMQGGVKGIRALGDYYAQWGQIVLGSVGQLQGVNNAMLSRLHRQLEDARGQVDQLVAAILENRTKELELHEQRRSEDRAGDARTELARDALKQLGEAARTFLTARGVSPELADVLGSIGKSDELMAALHDPEVRALMQSPDNLKGLAAMLKAASLQQKAARDAAANTTEQSTAA
jgi:hypothetical protein